MKKKADPVESKPADTRTTFVRWQCPECGRFMSGLVAPEDHRARRCMGIPKAGQTKQDQVCGALMNQVMRIDNFKSSNEAA